MITYLEGDATYPIGNGPKIIMHVCNDRGGWGSGFVLALSKRWPEPEARYRSMGGACVRGMVQIVAVDQGRECIMVANMIAQRGYGASNTSPHQNGVPNLQVPLDYDALSRCLRYVADCARFIDASTTVHAPRIGCGLAGGTWDRVEPLIVEAFDNIPVFIYDLPGTKR